MRLDINAGRSNAEGPDNGDLIGAVWELRTLAHFLSKASPESIGALRNIVPIRVVACVEGCLKGATAVLINPGDPYRTDVRRLMSR
jgi:hypothetical protein